MMANTLSLCSKFRGCLVGCHIGDCLGSPFEDNPISLSTLSQKFSQYLESTDSDQREEVLYTDDTAMTLSIAKSLVEKKSFEPQDIAKRFVSEYFDDFDRGYGAHVVDVFYALKKNNCSDIFKPATLQFNGQGSYGNGAAMRIAPIALFNYNKPIEMLKDMAITSARITHAHQNGYNGALLQCLAIHQALKNNDASTLNTSQFVDSLLENMSSIEEKMKIGSDEKQPYCECLRNVKDLINKDMPATSEEVAKLLGNSISAVGSVPPAIYSFLRSGNPCEGVKSDNPFVRTIYFAISLGGDTDTIASMAGGIAGAYYGYEMIPKELQTCCESMQETINIADELCNLISHK